MTVTALRPAPRAPRVYLAGKIAKNLPWRHAALGDLLFLDQHREWSDYGRGVYETEKALDPDFFMTAHDRSARPFPSVGPLLFTLVGPFFVSCDHGCSHGLGMHAVASCNEGMMELDVQKTRDRVLKANLARIKGADFVFVHIDETDCFGTLVEIGYARGAGIPVHLHFGDKINAEERDATSWFATTAADYRARRRRRCVPHSERGRWRNDDDSDLRLRRPAANRYADGKEGENPPVAPDEPF